MELTFINIEQELYWKSTNQELFDEMILSSIGIPNETEIED